MAAILPGCSKTLPNHAESSAAWELGNSARNMSTVFFFFLLTRIKSQWPVTVSLLRLRILPRDLYLSDYRSGTTTNSCSCSRHLNHCWIHSAPMIFSGPFTARARTGPNAALLICTGSLHARPKISNLHPVNNGHWQSILWEDSSSCPCYLHL